VGLQNCGLFSSVNLKTVKHQEVQKSKLKGFQITCTKIAPQKPNTQKVKT
jgi:hypothetical protein